ncbi:MAG: OmpA family protein [Steroidobacteraceae bacterium]
MNTLHRSLFVGCLLVALSACSGDRDSRRDRDGTGESTPAQEQAGASTGAATWGGAGEASSLPESGVAGSGAGSAGGDSRIVYFEFDSSAVGSQYSELIAAEARRLTANRDLAVRLEGHTDERGSREYNIALGERRAQAVRRALLLLGVSESQVQTVSLGEERLAAEGGTEDAHSRNRRVEITDRP